MFTWLLISGLHSITFALLISFVCLFIFPQIRQKLKSKQEAMEKSEKAKQLRAMRKYGKKVRRSLESEIPGGRLKHMESV